MVQSREQPSLTEAQYNEIEPHIRRLVLWWTRTFPQHIDREDLLSAAWVGVCKAASRHDPARGASFKTYAMIRARGEMIDAFRNEHVANRGLGVLWYNVDWGDYEGMARFSTPAAEHGTKLPAEVFDAMERLDERTRKMLRLYFWEDKTMKEVGVAFGVTEARVSQILGKAKEKMRKALAKPCR